MSKDRNSWVFHLYAVSQTMSHEVQSTYHLVVGFFWACVW